MTTAVTLPMPPCSCGDFPQCIEDCALSKWERDELTLREWLSLKGQHEGGPMFMGYPDRWWEHPHYRCENGHVSTWVLRSEALGRDACLAGRCRARLYLTFPEDRDGPLVASVSH